MERCRVVGIVDADEAERQAICSCLEQAGFETLTFSAVDDALVGLDSGRRFDVAVVSLGLPWVDGWHFCRMLRSSRHSQSGRVGIVLVAPSHLGADPSFLAADLGADELVPVPIDADRLASSVRRALRREDRNEAPGVLIAEDDRLFAQQLAQLLEDEGYVAQTCGTVAEAMEVSQEHTFDLALIDYHLPDAKGDLILDAIVSQAGSCDCLMMTEDPRVEATDQLGCPRGQRLPPEALRPGLLGTEVCSSPPPSRSGRRGEGSA